MCKVLNKHRNGAPASAVYIGRGGKWGNPFRIGPDGDRAAVIAKYESWLRRQDELLCALGELCGRDLVCAPAACHGDLLLKLATARTKRCSLGCERRRLEGGGVRDRAVRAKGPPERRLLVEAQRSDP